jgi:Domain of unknown function (DUF4189)
LESPIPGVEHLRAIARNMAASVPSPGMKAAISIMTGAVAAVLLLGAEQASAGCQLQWQPDPLGGSGGYLDYVCGDPSAPTGNSDGSGGEKKRNSSFASIVVNMTTLNDGDNEFAGATSAGYPKRKKAVRRALRACRRDLPGRCKSIVTARNGWAALIVTARKDGSLVVFGGNAKKREPAFQEANARARRAFGGTTPNPIERVKAVRSRAR